jgi:hypothetical protein
LNVHSFGVDWTNNKKKTEDSFKWREFLNMVLNWYHTKLSIWRAWEDSIELAFSSTESIIAARRFSEFIAEPASHPIAYVLLHVVHERGEKQDNAALALEGLGDWKRYGVQPLIVSKEELSADVSLSVIYYALKRWHFDGETENDGEDQWKVLFLC